MNTKYIIILVLVFLIILFIRKIFKKCKKPEFFELNPSFDPDEFFLEYDGDLSGTDVKIDNFESNVSLKTDELCIGNTCIKNNNLNFLDTLARKIDKDLCIGKSCVHESDFEQLNKFSKKGLIVPFYYEQASDLNNLPNYWKICDGKNGTPDLRDRFIIGASDNKIGEKGGQSTVILKEDHLPIHKHDMNLYNIQSSKDYNSNCVNDGSPCNAGIDSNNLSTTDTASKTDGITIKTSKNNKVQDAIDIMPPYYSLVYIMMV